ncbi:MAG: hypothetical protein IBJ15_00120 [Alphaproteobacteria bacterium]|nr:hypothetical protein [Alphaproteobacteria bacterium]
MLERAGPGRQAWRTLNPATLRAIARSGRLDPYLDLLPGLAGVIAAARACEPSHGGAR